MTRSMLGRRRFARETGLLDELVSARADRDRRRCQRAENAVVVHFLSVATAVARRYQRRGIDLEDLEQVARLGLVKAVRRWQPDRGNILSYAIPTLDGELKRYFRDNGTTIRIPRALYENQPRVMAATKELLQETSRDPAVQDIADRSGLSGRQVRQVQSAAKACRPISTDQCQTVDQMACPDAEESLSTVDLRTWLRPALATLPKRERTIIVLRFIWDQSQVQIASSLGISQMQVSRLLRAALDKLRQRAAAAGESWRDVAEA